MGDLVTLRPVAEDDLSWLAGLTNGPVASGWHEWHGWRDPQRRRRRWAESGLLGEDGGTLIVMHDAAARPGEGRLHPRGDPARHHVPPGTVA